MSNALAFGCPECGRRIDLQRQSVGRRVRCGRCGTLVEVPFFPRQFGRKRSKRRQAGAWAAVGLVAVTICASPFVAWAWWQGTIRSGHFEDFRQAVASLEEAESRGDLASAFLAAEKARSLATQHEIDPPGGLDRLSARRDDLARRDVDARLASISSKLPEVAFEEARALCSGVNPTVRSLLRLVGSTKQP